MTNETNVATPQDMVPGNSNPALQPQFDDNGNLLTYVVQDDDAIGGTEITEAEASSIEAESEAVREQEAEGAPAGVTLH